MALFTADDNQLVANSEPPQAHCDGCGALMIVLEDDDRPRPFFCPRCENEYYAERLAEARSEREYGENWV